MSCLGRLGEEVTLFAPGPGLFMHIPSFILYMPPVHGYSFTEFELKNSKSVRIIIYPLKLFLKAY